MTHKTKTRRISRALAAQLSDPVTVGVVDTSQGVNQARALEVMTQQRDAALRHLSRRANAKQTLVVLDQYLDRVEAAVNRLKRVEKLVGAVLHAVQTFEEGE